MEQTMIHLRHPAQTGIVILAVGLLVLSTTGVASGIDRDALDKAKEALQQRTEARLEAGWKPKSKEEQLLTRLRASQRRWERRQMDAAQRSEFEQAKSDVYLQLAKHYASIVHVYTGYQTSLVEDRLGNVVPITTRGRYTVVDPLAAAIAARWGEKAARSNGFAAAQRYRANTYYARQVENAGMRIRSLETAIQSEARLAGR